MLGPEYFNAISRDAPQDEGGAVIDKAAIREAYADPQRSIESIAAEHGVSMTTVCALASGVRRTLTSHASIRMVALHTKGEGILDLCRRFGCSPAKARQVLSTYGVYDPQRDKPTVE